MGKGTNLYTVLRVKQVAELQKIPPRIRMHQNLITILRPKIKNFGEVAQSPPQTLPPVRKGTSFPTTTRFGAFSASILVPTAVADPGFL